MTANNNSQFSGGEDDKGVPKEEKKDVAEGDERNKLNLMPRDGRSQQYNASTPQMRGTRKRKIRDKEEQISRPQKHVQSTQHWEGNTTAAK